VRGAEPGGPEALSVGGLIAGFGAVPGGVAEPVIGGIGRGSLSRSPDRIGSADPHRHIAHRPVIPPAATSRQRQNGRRQAPYSYRPQARHAASLAPAGRNAKASAPLGNMQRWPEAALRDSAVLAPDAGQAAPLRRRTIGAKAAAGRNRARPGRFCLTWGPPKPKPIRSRAGS
jgi:hypothetical protein